MIHGWWTNCSWIFMVSEVVDSQDSRCSTNFSVFFVHFSRQILKCTSARCRFIGTKLEATCFFFKINWLLIFCSWLTDKPRHRRTKLIWVYPDRCALGKWLFSYSKWWCLFVYMKTIGNHHLRTPPHWPIHKHCGTETPEVWIIWSHPSKVNRDVPMRDFLDHMTQILGHPWWYRLRPTKVRLIRSPLGIDWSLGSLNSIALSFLAIKTLEQFLLINDWAVLLQLNRVMCRMEWQCLVNHHLHFRKIACPRSGTHWFGASHHGLKRF